MKNYDINYAEAFDTIREQKLPDNSEFAMAFNAGIERALTELTMIKANNKFEDLREEYGL